MRSTPDGARAPSFENFSGDFSSSWRQQWQIFQRSYNAERHMHTTKTGIDRMYKKVMA